jgi:hypothetical protein
MGASGGKRPCGALGAGGGRVAKVACTGGETGESGRSKADDGVRE